MPAGASPPSLWSAAAVAAAGCVLLLPLLLLWRQATALGHPACHHPTQQRRSACSARSALTHLHPGYVRRWRAAKKARPEAHLTNSPSLAKEIK